MENTAKNFALQLGSLISLYVSISALTALLFGIITIFYPDTAQNSWEYEGATSTIRASIAFLFIFFPTYIILTRLVNTIRRTEHGTYLTLTKWLIYLSLLIGGGVLLGDLVFVLMSFLNGELTIRFVLKAVALFGVVSAAFVYYVLDARNYWQAQENKSKLYAALMGAFVVVVVIFGLTKIETPSQVRETNIDRAQVYDLQNIQSYIESYYQVQGTLPKSIDQLYEGLEAPTASESRAPYTFVLLTDRSYKLCAEFVFASSKSEKAQYSEAIVIDEFGRKNSYNWEHGTGKWCFERAVQPVVAQPIGKPF